MMTKRNYILLATLYVPDLKFINIKKGALAEALTSLLGSHPLPVHNNSVDTVIYSFCSDKSAKDFIEETFVVLEDMRSTAKYRNILLDRQTFAKHDSLVLFEVGAENYSSDPTADAALRTFSVNRG